MKLALALAAAAALTAGLWWAQREGPADAVAAARPPVLPASDSPLGWSQPRASEVASAAVEPAAVASLTTVAPAQALRTLTKCYAANSCRLTRGEGMDEHFEVVRLLLGQLDRLAAQGTQAEQAAWARELLAFPDGHVQAAALALAARLPPSAETTGAAVAALARTYDAVLLAKAYPVLQQWQQLGLTSGYDDMFIGLVHTGGWQAAQSVAENIGPFLNAGNVGRFEQVARQLQPGVRQQALLRSLRDYELQRRGG
ncbi:MULTISPECIES: hypothetical protein [unclassified Roseateles]|uniref:hypothetical protein n=1 Tax=unclassified Roseateles TaxID=2626991 RepID=UPI0006F638B4|nr:MULTISPECIES: hypothetical protein [unclassified Roseateles]KQW45531.1 hypothetical protein ASC81_11535 [Pelomonas sp. Root405]KRA72375.1 hypothetical protein ASD88_11535 [Pelomonas sp. Root662]